MNNQMAIFPVSHIHKECAGVGTATRHVDMLSMAMANEEHTCDACICFCSSACSWGAWCVISNAFLYTSLFGSCSKQGNRGSEHLHAQSNAAVKHRVAC